ncbi:MAG: lysophospholipid acyltransferase family protein [Lapillicoccus sp.]
MTAPTTMPTAGATRHGACLRHHLWRLVFAGTGGLTVTGPLPRGPAVLVANHASHADTAALMAAVPPASKPVFAAAVDYWFARPVRRLLVTTLAAAVPVERDADGAYAALRAASAPVLASGGMVILYPEGTRSTDGTVGRFAFGAVRLAHDLGVPVVPVALLGTADVLPKNGSFHAVPVEVRFGAARSDVRADGVDETRAEAARLRDVVVSLREAAPVADPRSPLGVAVERYLDSPWGLVGAFAWGFAEAVSWPLIAESYLVLIGVTSPRRMVPAALALSAGSVAGVVTTAALSRRGHTPPAPLTSAGMRRAAAEHLRGGAWGVRHQAFNGIPVKVYAAQAGWLGIPLPRLAGAVAVERTARIVAGGVVGSAVARVLRAPVRRRYGTYALVAEAAWVVGVRAVSRRWD